MKFGTIVKKFTLNKKEIIIRYPKIEDLEGLWKLMNSLVQERAYIDIQSRVSKREELQWLIERIKNIENKLGILLIVEDEKEIKGFAIVERFGITEPAFHIGELKINLTQDVRRIGLGTRLLLTTIREAKKRLKIKIIFIDVAKPNKIALKFYEKHGFKIVGKIKRGFRYYGKYFDAIILVKYL